jgi:hypothetical protein
VRRDGRPLGRCYSYGLAHVGAGRLPFSLNMVVYIPGRPGDSRFAVYEDIDVGCVSLRDNWRI